MSPVVAFAPDKPKITGFDPDPQPAVPGNIDLHSRPVVKNPDGSISTVRSKSFNMDGKEVLLPTISDDGRNLSDRETIDLYRRTGKHLGMFNSPEEATAYAIRLHEQQAQEYAQPPQQPLVNAARPRQTQAVTPAAAREANIHAAKAKKESWTDYLAAGVSGALGLIPALDIQDPATAVATYAEGAATEAANIEASSPSGVTRGVRLGLATLPVVGTAASRVLGPAQAYEAGRAPSHEENVAAVEGGVTTAGAIAAPAIIKRINNLRAENIMRARGVAPEAAAVETPKPAVTSFEPDATQPAAAEATPQQSQRAQLMGLDDAVKKAEQAHIDAVAAADKRFANIEVTPFGKRPKGSATIGNVEYMTPKAATELRESMVGPTRQSLSEAQAARDAFHRSLAQAPPEPAGAAPEQAPATPSVAAESAPAPPESGSAPAPAPPAAAAPPPELPPTVRAAAAEPTPPPAPLPPVEAPDYHAALRTRFAGERDVRRGEANTISNYLRDSDLTKVEREGLLVRRAFKGDPAELDKYAEGTHPNLEKPGARPKIEALSDVIESARNPTPAMLQADAVLDNYFKKTLDEGRNLGFLDSSIAPEEYINHLLQPGDEATASEGGYTYGQGGGIRRTTPHAIKRGYANVLDAIANGAAPRTLDAADAVSIYGDRHGQAAAARILENTLKESEIGKIGTPGNVPEDWVKLGGEGSPWEREVPYHDRRSEESKLAVAHQALYVPPKIAEALRPITDPNALLSIPGYRQFQRFQDYIKSANVVLALFHLKAETVNAFANMRLGPVDMAKAYLTPLDDANFLSVERTAIRHGMQTSIVGQTAEAYRALEPKAVPTKVDAIRNLPVMRQLDAAAQATSKLTFDIAIRKYKVMDFASQDAAWMAKHPNATPVELARARRSIAREVNAVYGGLNWEALGITRTVHAIMRALMFAPDWAYSNVETVNMAATKGGPGGSAARWYMARSVAGGMAATAALTYFFTGKKPDQVPGRLKDKLFNVYLGKDDKGNDKFMNVFFAGAPSDMINMLGNVTDYGVFRGVGATIANKMATVPRAASQVITNKDFIGRDIIPKDAGPVAGTALSIKHAAKEMSPIPFGAKNAAEMALDPKREYSPAEYAAAVTLGVRPRHVKPQGTKPEAERNSTMDIIMGAPVHKGRKPFVSPFRRAMDSVADKLTRYRVDPGVDRVGTGGADVNEESQNVPTLRDSIPDNLKFARNLPASTPMAEVGDAIWDNDVDKSVRAGWGEIHKRLQADQPEEAPDVPLEEKFKDDPEALKDAQHDAVEAARDRIPKAKLNALDAAYDAMDEATGQVELSDLESNDPKMKALEAARDLTEKKYADALSAAYATVRPKASAEKAPLTLNGEDEKGSFAAAVRLYVEKPDALDSEAYDFLRERVFKGREYKEQDAGAAPSEPGSPTGQFSRFKVAPEDAQGGASVGGKAGPSKDSRLLDEFRAAKVPLRAMYPFEQLTPEQTRAMHNMPPNTPSGKRRRDRKK